MVGTQTLATVVPDCLEPDPANGLMPRIVGVLGTFALFLDTSPVLLHHVRKDAFALGESGILCAVKAAVCICGGDSSDTLDPFRQKKIPDPLRCRQEGSRV